MLKRKQSSSQSMSKTQRAMGNAKKKLYMQAALMCCTIVMTVVLLFAMTAAWYTNIIQAGTLVFEAETWGFEGSVLLEEEKIIQAAPGDTGIVELSVTNEGESTSTVSVSVTKSFTDSAELMSRIYFYVDEMAVINGETVSRQYLNNTNGYSYTLFSGNTLLLTEKVHTDALVRWEWVYDVLGYYFKDTQDDKDGFTVEEYLRPVGYNYDEAIFDEDGGLTGISEDVSLEDFLVQLTASDGYEGAYKAVKAEDGTVTLQDEAGNTVQPVSQCYPIDEENGIWLYLCTKEDVENNTIWDTNYGSQTGNDANAQLHARITLTGHQTRKDAVTVSNGTDLEKLLNETAGGIVQLGGNLTVEEPIVLNGDAEVMLDLNGHQISYANTENASEPIFTLSSGTNLTVVNGSIAGDSSTNVFKAVGGNLTLNQVSMDGVYNAITVRDHETQNPDGDNSIIRVMNCDLKTNDVTVMLSGDGTASDGVTTLVIQNSTLVSTDWAVIYGNGSTTPAPGRWGTDIQIIGSTLTGYYTGIYHPQKNSQLTVSGNSVISGINGITMKGGSLEIIDSTVSGFGTSEQHGIEAPSESNPPQKSGFLQTGDGIYMETNYGYSISLAISGDSLITSVSAEAVRMYPQSKAVTMNITGGKFSKDISRYLTDNYTQTYDAVNALYVVGEKEPETTE